MLFSKTHDSKTVIKELNQIFNDIDGICDKTKCEKVKTIGDCYMAICTCKNNNVDTFDYAIRIVQLGIQVMNHNTKNAINGRYHSIVVGIATGPLIQGLIYGKKLSYEVWGETCSKAGELLNLATPNRIMVCSQTFKESNFKFRYIQKKEGYELQV